MSRTVSAWVTWRGDLAGFVGPFPVDVPWWAEVEPVVAYLRRALGVPVLVLRMLTAWTDAWAAHAPGGRPGRALAIAEPLAHLIYAVRYQEFLDGIEPSERIYHRGDPAASIRAALRCALSPASR